MNLRASRGFEKQKQGCNLVFFLKKFLRPKKPHNSIKKIPKSCCSTVGGYTFFPNVSDLQGRIMGGFFFFFCIHRDSGKVANKKV